MVVAAQVHVFEGKILKKLCSLFAFALITFAGMHAAQAQSSPTPAPMMSPSPAMSPGTMMNPAVAPSGSPSPSPSPSPPPHLFQLSGFGDAAYSSRLGNTQTEFITGAPSRVFDYNDRSPDLQNLNVNLALNAGNLTGKVELSAGTDADIIQSWPGAFNGFDVTQAYLAYQFGKLSLQAGKFETLAGAEVIESPSDLNFSRSILFGFAVPFTHTGGRLTYAVTPHVNVIGGVNAGWDEIRSTNGRLTAEYGFAFNPSSAVSLTAQGYTGIEQASNYTVGFNPYTEGFEPAGPTAPGSPSVDSTPSGAQGQRTLIDIVGTVHPTAATTFTVNYDHGRQQNFDSFGDAAGWSGLAGYLSYQLNPKIAATVRYEGFDDPEGYRTGLVTPTGQGPFWHEGTFTLGYNLSSVVTLRAEYRHDAISGPYFLNTDGVTGNNNNSTVALEGFVKF
jgi:hypothetical protein